MIKVTGVLMYYDTVNGNGHKYPQKSVVKAVKKFNRNTDNKFGMFIIDEYQFRNMSYNKLPHVVNLTDITHKVLSVYINEENKSVVCEIEILDTPQGKMVQAMMNSGNKFASCIVGEMDWVTNNFVLHRIDIIPEQNSAWFGCELKIC